MRKIIILLTALMVTGCYDEKQRIYDIEQAQHERALSAIMTIYDAKCAAGDLSPYPNQPTPRDDSFCNGLRESYWVILSSRNMQGFENTSEPSAR